jgi:hypothetical protein
MKLNTLTTNKNINLSVSFTKQIKKAFRFIVERYEKEIATWTKDLKPFVKDQSDINARQLASRLVNDFHLCEPVGRGIIIPKGYEDDKKLRDNVNLSILTKARSVRQRKYIINARRDFAKSVKPFIESPLNQWSDLLTHNINAKFDVANNEKFYQHLIDNANEKPKKDKGDIMIVIPTDEYRSYRFHVYPTKMALQIGTTDSPIKATEESFREALIKARNGLLEIGDLWSFNFDIPPIDDWTVTVTHLHRDTINKDYMAYDGGGIENYGLAIHLYNHVKKGRDCLRLEVKLTTIQLKPKDMPEYFARNDPFKILQTQG